MARSEGAKLKKDTNACDNIVVGGSPRTEERQAASILVHGNLEGPMREWRSGDGVAIVGLR